MSTLLNHPVLGSVTLTRSARARRLSLSVRPSGEVRLTFPWLMAKRDAVAFLEAKQAWVERAQARMRARRQSPILPPYHTRSHTLQLTPDACTAPCAKVKGGVIAVHYPAQLSAVSESVQTVIRQGIEEAWRVEAKAYLPQRTAELAVQHGFRHGRISIRNSRTRWGSCSVRNDISLSLHLMKLPDELIDYILLHELCHTQVKNHGPHFHALLDRVTNGQHLTLRHALRGHSTRW